MLPRTAGPLVALVAVAALLTGCSGNDSDTPGAGAPSTTSASGSPAPEPDPAPVAGQCHRTGWTAAVSPVPTARTVPCGRAHTAQTYFVGDLEATTESVDDPGIQDLVAKTCSRRLVRHVGADARELRLSMVTPIWFTPSLEQVELGADWFRCDVVVVAAEGTLTRLPKRSKGIANDPATAMCGTAEPSTPAFRRVACARKHAWRAAASVDLPGKKYPTPEQSRSAMEEPCREAAEGLAENPLTFTWSEERPTREQWRSGRRYGLCWVPAT